MHFITNSNISATKTLISPECVIDEIPITQMALDNVVISKEIIKNILNKTDERLIIVIGSSYIYDFKTALEYAHKLQKFVFKYNQSIFIIMKTYFKNLKSLANLNNTFNKDIKLVRELLLNINELGIPVGIDICDSFILQYISDLVSWGDIHSESVESHLYSEIVSGFSFPVGFNNSFSGNIQPAIDAIKLSCKPSSYFGINLQGIISMIYTCGNPWTHIILNGSDSGTNYHDSFIDVVKTVLMNNNLIPNIFINCSSNNSQKNYKNQIKIIKYIINLISLEFENITGLIIESDLENNCNRCINWDNTQELLESIYNAVKISKRYTGMSNNWEF